MRLAGEEFVIGVVVVFGGPVECPLREVASFVGGVISGGIGGRPAGTRRRWCRLPMPAGRDDPIVARPGHRRKTRVSTVGRLTHSKAPQPPENRDAARNLFAAYLRTHSPLSDPRCTATPAGQLPSSE